MSELGYMIWFLATALMTVTVLTICTLAAADLLRHRRRLPEQIESAPAAGNRVHDSCLGHGERDQDHHHDAA